VLDTLLAVYKGSSLTNLTLVAQDDDVDGNTPTSAVSFNASANTSYQIAVDGYDGEPGTFELHLVLTNNLWLAVPEPRAGGGFKLLLTAAPGYSYVLEKSTNLIGWDRLATLPDANGALQYFDSATNNLQRFYRAQPAP